MKTAIVTCVYLELYNTEFGGNLRNPHAYYYSLNAIAKCGLPIYCFTSAKDANILKKEIKYDNVFFEIFELQDSIYHEKIITAKNNPATVIDKLRCYELEFNKIHNIDIIFNKYDYESIIWIDAALSNRNLIPKRYFNLYDAIDGTIEHFDSNVFNKTMMHNITLKSAIKPLFIYTLTPQHYTGFIEKYTIEKYLIAGLFSFNRCNFNSFLYEYTSKLNILLNKNILCMEEVVFSYIYHENPKEFNLFEFNGWHHCDNLIGNSCEPTKPFYKILADLAEL